MFRRGGRWRWKRVSNNNTNGNMEEELEPNLDQVIDNIQVKPIEPIQLVVSIVEPKQLVVVVAESSQLVQLVVEHVHVENPQISITQHVQVFGHFINNLKQISFQSKLPRMLQLGQGHCKNLPTLKLSMNNLGKICLKPIITCKPIAQSQK